MVISPCGLFQLLTCAKRRVGTRVVSGDGSGGFCKNESFFVTIGCPNVGYIKTASTTPEVTTQLRTICYLHLGGERYHPCRLALCQLRQINHNCLRRISQLTGGPQIIPTLLFVLTCILSAIQTYVMIPMMCLLSLTTTAIEIMRMSVLKRTRCSESMVSLLIIVIPT